MYFGCLHKVFLPELDIAPFSATTHGRRARSDPYGPLRVFRPPLPQCPVSVERAYAESGIVEKCMNPAFVWSGRNVVHGLCEAPKGESGGSV